MRRVILSFVLLATMVVTTGCYAAAGPTLGLTDGTVSMGWEASTGLAPAHVSVGQFHRKTPARYKRYGAEERITYLVGEVWALVGGSLGVAWSDLSPERHLIGGLWEGAPLLFNGTNECGDGFSPVGSVSIGWRNVRDGHEFYVAPKLGYAWCNGIDAFGWGR